MTLSRHGDVTSAGRNALLCDLMSPVHAGTLISFELIDGPAVMRRGARRQWQWTVTGGPSQVIDVRNNPKPYRFEVPNVGSITVKGELLSDGRSTFDISKTLSIISNTAVRTSWSSGSNMSKAITEITTDLKDYIDQAAAATGANGISPRFLASVLLIEIRNRPKEDRFSELEQVREEITEIMNERNNHGLFSGWNANIFLHKSIGLGQTKLSTLAMALGWMPLFEHDRVGSSGSAEDQIKAAFMRLRSDQMMDLWRRLAWSKSAVDSVARVLKHLKNRSNRYPSLTRAAFGANSRAMQIIATEYNMGATNSPQAAAGPTGYGRIADAVCTGPGGSGYEAATIPFRIFSHP